MANNSSPKRHGALDRQVVHLEDARTEPVCGVWLVSGARVSGFSSVKCTRFGPLAKMDQSNGPQFADTGWDGYEQRQTIRSGHWNDVPSTKPSPGPRHSQPSGSVLPAPHRSAAEVTRPLRWIRGRVARDHAGPVKARSAVARHRAKSTSAVVLAGSLPGNVRRLSAARRVPAQETAASRISKQTSHIEATGGLTRAAYGVHSEI